MAPRNKTPVRHRSTGENITGALHSIFNDAADGGTAIVVSDTPAGVRVHFEHRLAISGPDARTVEQRLLAFVRDYRSPGAISAPSDPEGSNHAWRCRSQGSGHGASGKPEDTGAGRVRSASLLALEFGDCASRSAIQETYGRTAARHRGGWDKVAPNLELRRACFDSLLDAGFGEGGPVAR